MLDRSARSSNTSSGSTCATGTTPATQNPNDVVVAISQNFNQTETWGALSGYTNRSTASRNTLGVYDKSVSVTGTQSASIPLSASDSSTGVLLALQASNVVSCAACALVQSTDSGNQTSNYDHIALSNVVPGDTLLYMQWHSNWSGAGTTTMNDSSGVNVWYPCNTNTGGSTSVTMTDLQWGSTYGMECFYAPVVPIGGTITGQITSSDCAGGCTYVGGFFAEFSGALNWEGFSNSAASATSGTGSNNVNCGSLTTGQANDLLVCGIQTVSGTLSAGTSPVSFTMFNTVNGDGEYGIWPSSGTTSPTETASGSGIGYGGMAVAFR